MNPAILGFFRKELVQTLRDKRMRMMLFVAPIMQMTIFGLAISTEVRHIKLAAVYAPSDTLARRLEEKCLGSGWFQRAEKDGTDPFHWIRSGRADAVLLVPEGGLTRSVGRGEGRLQLLIDSSNITKARIVEVYVKAILARTVSESYPGTLPAPPVQFAVRSLYNPSMQTSAFMVPGVLCMILCMVTIVLTSSSMAREKESGTFETLLASPATTIEILLGKSLPYVLLGMADIPLVTAVAVFGFGVPMRGSLWVLLLASFFFICNTVALGILLSTFVKNLQQAAMGGFFLLFPAIQLSGVMYPVENMPALLKFAAYLDPLQYFVALLRNIMLKGGDPQLVATNIGALILLGALTIWVSFKRFHQKLN